MIDEGLKDRLLDALQSSVGYVNDGDAPNAAVAKAAAAADFNTEQTCRLCELFNTSRTIYHFENRPEEKTAEFDLVDKDVVVTDVFGNAVKPAEERVEAPLLPDYTEYYGKELDAANGKLAGELLPLPGSDLLDVPDLEAQAQRITTIMRTQRKMADHGHSEARMARETANQRLQSLASQLSSEFWLAGSDKYARLIRSYDDKNDYAPVLTALQVYMPEHMTVSDETLTKVGYVVDDRDLVKEQTTMSEIKEALEGAANLEALAREVDKEAAETITQFERAIEPVVPKVGVGEFDNFFTTEFKRGQAVTKAPTQTYPSIVSYMGGVAPQEGSITKTSPSVGQSLQTAMDATKGVGVGMDAVIGEGESDFNKKITERLKNQQREVLLQDLLVSDPFIAEADPGTVAAIYSQIMQVAPEVSMNKEVVRAILRQGLHNVTAVSPFDAASWADLEKTINEVRGTLPEKPKSGRPPMQGDRR